MSREHRYEIVCHLPRPRDEVFAFLADPHNLDRLTPEWLRFRVLSPVPATLASGTTIDYRFRWRWLALRWRSEITRWQPPARFDYAQRRGPYRGFHHEHHFVARDGGTDVIDRLRFSPRGGFLLGRLLAPYLRADVDAIFRYRVERLREIFPPVRPE